MIEATERPPHRAGVIERLSVVLALLGGAVVLGVALLVSVSVLGRWLGGFEFGRSLGLKQVSGDFEIAQMGTAVAVFSFFALCQVKRGNIMVDTFTTGLPGRAIRRIDALWDVLYAVVGGILVYCLANGAADARASQTAMMTIPVVLWPAFVAACLLMSVTTVVALVTALRQWRGRT
jgi:hypothetical protein